ncbi:PLxRFG domain-containing protein [Bilophila wadsworthia]|uniref:PLxRFG domain-containing protein n=1 Tax=Bilophila wadsworthia TaxID=35833 RepID=UPI002431041A|nr:PLxRFG domain-containing protein [Bilophila wadsworthia]
MKTIGEYRARYPQLRELTDYQLTRAVYDTTAPDMPLEDFAKAFGGVTEEDPEELKIQEYNLSHPDDPIRREDMGKASLLSDTGHGIAAGINELAAIPFWLAEEMGIESAGKAKDYFLKSAEEKRKGYSPEMKLAQTDEFFTEEPDGSYGLGGAWTSPRKILGSVAESAPGMVGGMGLSALAARGLMKAGFSRGLAWAVGSSLGEGTIGGAQNALDVHEAILAMPEDKLAASPEYQEILQRTGDPKRAREELANSVAAMTGLKTGASTAVLSAPSGYMFGKILGGETGKTLLGTAAKQGAAEFGEEAGQSGAEQYLSQAELQRADPTIDPMSGVGEAAVSGGFAGMAMGGGMGGFGHVLGGRAQQQPGAPAVSDAQPVLPPEQQAALPEGGHGSPLELGPGQNIVMGTDRAYEDPIATPPPTSPLQKGMEAILGGPLGLSTAPAAPDFAVTPGGRAVSANGIVQPDAFGPIAAGMRSDMPPLLADQVYDVDYSVVPDAPKALSEAPRGLPLGQDKSPVAPESPQPVAVQTDGESTPLQLTHINDKSFMLHGDTGPFEEAIKAAGGRLDRKVGGWRFPLAREGEIRELFSIPLGTETVPGNNLVSEASEASPDVLRETPLPVSGDMAMSGQTGLEVTHGGLQQGTTRTGTGELLSEPVRIDTTGNPGELDAVTGRPGDFPMGDRGSRPDMDTAVPGAGGTEAGLGAVVQRAAGPVEIPAEGVDASLLSPDRRNVPDGGAGRYAERGRAGRGFEGHGQMGRDVPGGSERAERAALEGNGTQGVEQKLLRAIERQNGELTPEAEAWARSLPPERQEAAWQQLTLDAFKGYTASNLRVDEASLKFIPLSKETNTSLQLKALANVFGQDLILFRDASKQPTGILGATVPAINNVIFMEENREGYRPHLSVLGHEMLHNLRNGAPRLYNEFKEYLLSEQKPDTLQRYREDLDRRTGHDGTVGRMSDDKILEEIGADLVGKRLTEESFWAKMAEERPSLFARVSQFVRDLLDRVTAAFRADPLPAAWVKDFDAIRRHIDAMMGQWAEKNARAKTGGTPPHSENTREVLDGRDETVRNAGRNGGEGSDHAGGLLQSNRGRHGAPVDLVGDGGRGGDGGRAAQPAPEGREGERSRQPVAVKIPNRADEPAHYELLEAEDVRASHLPSRGFQKNPAYGLENERRYHDEPGSRAKVMENAAKLDPAFLMESVDANHGAPVIDHDNNVLGGNGRAMSIARAYESFPERGEQYREALKANADRLGIDPAQVDAMHSPMLVRRLERGMSREERQRLVTAMNDDFKDAKEKRASGKSRGERFGRRTLDMLSAGLKDAESLREYFDTPASVAVVERMMEDGVIQRSERNALVGADGLLNPDGKKVVEEALRGRIARSYEALAKLPADVVGKLDAVIPHILVAEGIGKPWNITEHVRDSVDLLVGFKGSGVKEPDTYLKQVNMLTGRAPVQDFSKQAIALFRMALDAKKGEYVKAFESYLKNAKLSPEAGNIPGVAKPQDKAFRDAFGMKTEAMPNKPEKREAEKPQTEEETKGQPPEEEIPSSSKSKKEQQEQTSGNPGDAGHVERHRALYKSLLNGKASLEDYHRGFSALLENEEAVRAELSGMTVNALLARGGAMFAWRHKGDKKADIVDALYRDMLSDFTLGQPYSVSGFMGMGPEEYRKATVASIRRIVDAQSEQTLADFARDAAAQREEYASRRKAEREAVENPKTLEDFRSFIRFHMDEGKTASEARDLLLFEQREQFDRLAAEASRSTRKTKAEPVLSSSSQTTGGEIIATKHTQKGHDLFVVRLEDRVSREDYLALLSSAKKLGGYYSKFRGNGAVPGFQFTGREQAEAFLKLAQGDKAEAQEAVKARRDAYKDDRSQTAVQRLNEMADRLDEDADASLNAARKVNTAKRAGQAAAADAMAYADKSLAKTMRNIAGAIGNGTATFLDRVREKKQVEQLRDALRMAKWEEDKTKYPAWDQREKYSEEPATTQTVEFAAFPLYRLYRSSWAELGRKLSEKDGTKSLGKKILSVADDVTETYLEFARSHLEEVSTYATQAGKPAVFKSREDAEKAIARSGYRGKAVVLPVKRGENRIILSPSAAQERGIWKGDDDRMLSLRPDLVDELFDKQGSTSRDIPWQLSDIRQKRKALARMGIETPAEYRMALREFVGLQAAAKQDKVRELERSVMRDAANNRGWLDFFPTPVAVTEEMLAAADIRPGMGVLEPSAGMGHIADRIREKGVEPVVAELEPQKRELLEAKGYEVVGKDFMKDVSEGKSYDRIVMNPPFSKRQDTEHVRRAYDLLKPGGRLVAIVSEGSFFGKDSKAAEFRDWLEDVGGTSERLAEGSFNDPSLPVTTGVNTRMVVIEKEGTPMASVTPGEFLPAMPSTRLRIRKAAVQRVADALGKRAANAADTRGVQSFEELPEHIRQLYGDVASRLEGVYDPASGTVYLVADNLHSTARAAEVWMHENMVHHGLNGLLGMDEKRRVLNRLWQGMGGMGNAEIASVANKYGVDPLWDVKDRALVMEEYLARLAEKRAAGKLSDQEQTLWRRFVEAVLRAWHALVDAVTGRTGSMKYENVDRLLSALDRYVFEGRPEGMAEGGMVPAMASVDRSGSDMEAAHAAWAQVQRDAEEWGRQVDAFHPHEGTGGRQPRLMAVCRTPDVLQKLGAPDLPMTMTADNLGKVLSDKVDHGLPKELVKQLPQALAEPIMVFESASQVDSFVVLTELKHEGRSVMAAVHLDTEKQRVRVNDIASAYKRSNEAWYARQIEEGRLLYQDKKKSLAWARTNRLQLPRVRKLPSRLSEKRVLTEEDIVKPIDPDNKPLASLRDIKDVRDITGMSAEDAMNLAQNDPWIGSIFGKSDDVTLMQRIFMLPHWVAKRFPGFKAVYDRQVRRQDERAAERARSLQEIPSLFGENKLSGKDMGELKKLVWDNDGKQIAELEGIDKFLTDEELESGRTTIKANPEWYEGYDKWLSRQPGSDAVKKAMREIRVSLDNDLMRAHNRLARMREMGDVAIQEFRTQIGHIHNYFPHHRYGDYFIQGKDKKGEVVYREHFDALHKRYARRHFENRLEALKEEYPDTVFDLDENTKLPDEAFGRVLDPEAMEQVFKAALSKVSDKEQAERIAEVLHESVADVMKSSGWGSHAIGRKNIPGFEKDDLFRVLYDYKSGLTGWLTKMESSKDFAEALGKINAKAHPQEWSYTSQYVKDMLRNGDRVDRTVGTIKSAAFAWYLGGNIKTAVLNLTQNVIVGVPRLQMDVEGGARAYIDGAQKQIVNQYARRFTGDKGKGLSEEEARLIQELYGDALITDAYMEEVRGQVTGGPSTRFWNKLMKVMGYPMSVAERFNRGSLALAAFRAARDGKMKAAARKRYGVEGEKATYEQAKAFAEEVVRDSHFVYGKTNAPELLRSSTAGRGLGAAFTFKTFTANLLGLWSWALRTQGKEGRIMVAKGLASTIALGGLVSTPFYATVMALVQAVSGDDDDWTEAIRKQLPQNTMLRDIVCYGLPAGAGVNLGGSLKMELALTGGMQKGGTPKEVLTEGIGDIIGIPWDMFVERPSKVMESMRADNYWRAVEEVVPTAVSNGMKAWRLATEGQKTLKGRDINDPGERGARRLSSGEALGKLLGFQPVSATRSYDAYAASRHSDGVRADKADEVATIMVKALDAGDSAEMVRARKVLKDWNVKMEEEGKPHMRILMKDVQKRVTQRRRKARMTPKARQKGEAFQSVWG